MKRHSNSQSALFNPRLAVAFSLCAFGLLLGVLSLRASASANIRALPEQNFGGPLVNSPIQLPPVPLAPGTVPSTTSGAKTPPPSTTGAANGSWSIIPSPDLTSADGPTTVNAVTCISRSDCWGVGYYVTVLNDPHPPWHTFTEHWDGSSWTLVPSPNTSLTQTNFLSGVSCVSTT